jgi:antitoxin (DNA-binding transcriptional repressor) of toxin-antitoxin stability system
MGHGMALPGGRGFRRSAWIMMGNWQDLYQELPMTTKIVDIREARKQLNELLTLALEGTEIIFQEDDTPLARLSPIGAAASGARIAGLHEGTIWVSEDYDEPLPDDFWFGQS